MTKGSKSIYYNLHLSGENSKNFIALKMYMLSPYVLHGSETYLRQQCNYCILSLGWIGIKHHFICIFFLLQDYMGI